MSEAIRDMVVYHAHGLHEGVTNCWPHELESPAPQVFAHGLGLRRTGGDIGQPGPGVLNGPSLHELPDIMVKGSELFLYLQEGPGIFDGGIDFEPVSDDPGINEQAGQFLLRVSGDFRGVKIVEGLSIAFPLSENGQPTQSGLGAFQN